MIADSNSGLERQWFNAEVWGHPLFRSRLFLFCSGVLLIYLHIIHNGYECFRSDHITQIPLLYLQDDPSLFARDWFLKNYGHFDVRFFHLWLIRVFSLPMGLPTGILLLFLVLILATIWAWIEISKKLYGSPLPGLIAGIAAVYVNGTELGTNHLLENIMIPRTEAYAFAYWGLFLILAGRPFLAGCLMGLSAYSQMAVGGFFAVPMLVWMLTWGGGARRWRDAGWFLGGFVLLLLYPLIFKSKGFLSTPTLSDEETIRLAAFIRHPHHMEPHTWGGLWAAFLFLAILAFNSWRKLKTLYPRAWSLAWMAVIIMAILAVATFFIEIHPVKNVVLAQPYRVAVLLYFLLFLLLAPHLLNLLSAPGVLPTVRAVGLVLGLQSWVLFSAVALVELFLMSFEDQRRPLPAWLGWLLLAAADGAAVAYTHSLRNELRAIAIVAAVLVVARSVGCWRRPRLLQGLAGGAVAAGALAISSFFWLPYSRWIEDESGKHAAAAAQRCYDYEFKPLPIMALERLGVWAQAHTPQDALFLIPPEREPYGFHIWSKRAVVFAVKFFPYNPHGLKEWKERFLAIQGITETNSRAGKLALQEVMDDIGGRLVNETYCNLTVNQVLDLARRYDANYIITQAKYRHPRLEELRTDYNHTKSKANGKLYRLYQIRKEPVAALAG